MILAVRWGSKIPLFLVLLFLTTSSLVNGQNLVLPRIPLSFIIDSINTEIEIFRKKEEPIKAAVKLLFEADELDHEGTKAYNPKAKFEDYWKVFSSKWFFVDMNADKIPELVFSGTANSLEEKEFFQLYSLTNKSYKQLFWDEGHFAGFIKQPKTKEIILVHHRYPCCYNASHNINKIRLIGKDLHFEKRLLLARDEGMKGNFFPSKANFDPKVYRLKEEKPLYWSSEIIEKDAFSQSQSNQITVFPVGTNYQVLSRNNKWLYVQILDAPPIVPSRVINPSNLQETRLIGWFYFP